MDTYADARNERQAIESVCEILLSNGIEIDPDNIQKTDALITMRTVREFGMEEALAQTFLGIVEVIDKGTIYIYENAHRGSAEFSSAGDFEIWLNEGAITNTNESSEKTIQSLLSNLQLAGISFDINYDEKRETVIAVSMYKNAEIFNCSMDFVFREGSLRTVAGRYLTGIEDADASTEISQTETALLAFLAAVKRGDIECTEIVSVESGYLHSVVGSFGEGVISPVWMIATDQAKYAVDSSTGEIRLL